MAEEELLDKILFGGSTSFLKSLEEAEEHVDSHKDSGIGETDSETNCVQAWTDEDSEITVGRALNAQKRKLPEGGINDRSNKYMKLLQHKFESIHSRPKWARLNKPEEDSDEDDEILQTCGFTKKQRSLHLPPSVLEYKEIRHLNCETYNEGPYINSIEFLHESTVALVAGQSGIATLYAVSGKKNIKLHSINFQNFPIFCAKIVENKHEVIFGSRHPYIHCFDLMAAKSTKFRLPPGLTTCKKFTISSDQSLLAVAGKWGEIHLLSTKTKEKVGILKQNDDVTALSFGFENDLLYAHSTSGEITIFDVNMRKVKHKFIDEGCLQGTTLAVSPSNRFLAAGSAQGVVNLYDTHCIYQNETPKPEKAVMNLTTKISSLAFNSTSEILGYASVDIPNSVKLYHIGSCNTFKNFPSFQTKFGNVNVLNFSPNSGYFALGNNKSTVSLCRLNHYKNY
ncbi:U3 small nucleolar RNA-associated protein 18 homolog [Coccinella septempunctata]|uniref:U3 small nucleolar RNA-associated protein 18 homolog n=1 Tax=Coccinella septempunctata TaxID=41139 RepID=UPI001D07A278|nr:U3 small nucleolar RNA-associated protein 18 homolog [Coccinella septempunctata]